jgi:membrane protein
MTTVVTPPPPYRERLQVVWNRIHAAFHGHLFASLWSEMGRTNMSLLASGVAFYGLLSIFPALAVVISGYALLADPGDVQWQMSGLVGIMPIEAWSLISDELKSLVQQNNSKLGIGLVISLAVAMWSARSASAAIMEALNSIYRVTEQRGFFMQQAVAFALTLGGLCFGIVALTAVAVVPAILAWLPISKEVAASLSLLRWPLLAGFMIVGFGLMYRFAPSRGYPSWFGVGAGAVVATFLSLLGSALFSFYVGRFGSYDKTYGSIGAVVVLLMWFYVSAFVTLIGALLDAELERRRDKKRKPEPAPG